MELDPALRAARLGRGDGARGDEQSKRQECLWPRVGDELLASPRALSMRRSTGPALPGFGSRITPSSPAISGSR